jgi:hypothetical protein
VPIGVLPLSLVVSREFENVGSGPIYTHGQRTEIVDAGDFDFAGVDGFEDAWEQTNADAMTELGVLEA